MFLFLYVSCLCPLLIFFSVNFSLSFCTLFSKEVMIEAPVSSALRNVFAGGEIPWVFTEKLEHPGEDRTSATEAGSVLAPLLLPSVVAVGSCQAPPQASDLVGDACPIVELRQFFDEQKENVASWDRIIQFSRR